MTEIPALLRHDVRAWIAAESPPQSDFAWRPSSWKRRFAHVDSSASGGVNLVDAVTTIEDLAAQKFNGVASRINRDLVTALHRPETLRPTNRAYDRQAVVTAFIAAMIWGYGTTGYGPYRTERVLTAPEAVDALVKVAATAQDKGGEKAFERIASERDRDRRYLKYLGPAFGTKYLSFLTLGAAPEIEAVPVMDAVVRRWFTQHTDIALNTWTWNPTSYRAYIAALDAWRGQLSDGGAEISRVDLEMVIFSRARGDASWTIPAQPLDLEELTTDALLDLLQDDVRELADNSDSERGPELLKDLAAWVDEAQRTVADLPPDTSIEAPQS